MKSLIFTGKTGYLPEPGTIEFIFLEGCAKENRKVWEYLSRCSKGEIEATIEHLQRLGWGFEWVTLQ